MSIFNLWPSVLFLFLLALCGFLFFYGLAQRDLWSSHEGRAAQNAHTILAEGCWSLPRLYDRHVELQKPPLYYWLVASVGWLRGGVIDAWSVRLPAALAGIGTVLVVFLLGSARPIMGLVTATCLATMIHFTWLARSGRIDIPLTFALTVTLAAFFRSWRCAQDASGPAWPWLLLAYLATAAAILLKGPIGLVLPAAVVLVFLIVERCLRRTESPNTARRVPYFVSLWWGVPLVVALAAPWYVWAGIQTDGALYRTFFWYHNFERAFGGDGGLRAHPWWFYGPRLMLDLFPWSLLLPVALIFLCRGGRLRSDPEARFGLVWLVTMLGVLSCVRFKRADYLLPAYPGAAILLGCFAEHVWQTRNMKHETRNHTRVLFHVSCFMFLVCACWWYYVDHVLPRVEPTRTHRDFAAAIRARVPSPQLLIFFRVEAHTLAFHVGQPLATVLEWENIDTWAGRPGSHYIVMPPECAQDWPNHVRSGHLEQILCNEDLAGGRHEQPLVLMRTTPHSKEGFSRRASTALTPSKLGG